MSQELIVAIVAIIAVLLIGLMVVGFAKALRTLGVRAPSMAPLRGRIRRSPDRVVEEAATPESPAADGPVPDTDGEPGIVIIGGQPIAWSGHAHADATTPPVVAMPVRPSDERPPTTAYRSRSRRQLGRASGFAIVGVAAIGVIALVVWSSISSGQQSGDVLAASTPSSSLGSGTPDASATPSETIVVPVPPASAVAALRGTAVINGRIAADGTNLRTTLARKGLSASDLAKALRVLAADAAAGIDLTSRMAPWTAASTVQTGLANFYSTIASTARDGLHAPLSDLAAYRSTAKAMLKAVAGLGTIDAASRALAASAGLELPSIAVPSTAP